MKIIPSKSHVVHKMTIKCELTKIGWWSDRFMSCFYDWVLRNGQVILKELIPRLDCHMKTSCTNAIYFT